MGELGAVSVFRRLLTRSEQFAVAQMVFSESELGRNLEKAPHPFAGVATS